MSTRRAFITLIGGAAAAWPLTARAQQGERMRRIGVLMGYAESDSDAQAKVAAFRESLRKLGWAEGRNIQIDTRWPIPADLESMQRFAQELAAHHARELAGDGEAETGAAVLPCGRRIGLSELLEQLGPLLRCHTDAGIDHR